MQTIVNDEIKSLEHCYRSTQYLDVHRSDTGLAILDYRLQLLNDLGDCENKYKHYFLQHVLGVRQLFVGTANNIYAYDGVNFSPRLQPSTR